MGDWIEAIASRVVRQRIYGGEGLAPFVEISLDERDRLVAMARGVERLAEEWGNYRIELPHQSSFLRDAFYLGTVVARETCAGELHNVGL